MMPTISKYTIEWPTYNHDVIQVTVKRLPGQDRENKGKYDVKIYLDNILLWQTDELYCPFFYEEPEVVIAAIDFCIYDFEGKHGEEPKKWGVQLSDDLSTIELDLNEGKHYEYDQVDENWWQE